MAGGEVRLTAQGDVRGQAAVFGAGNLTVSAGGDLDGRFLAPFGDRPTLWISADSQSPVQVRRGDDVVGYVMPLREP